MGPRIDVGVKFYPFHPPPPPLRYWSHECVFWGSGSTTRASHNTNGENGGYHSPTTLQIKDNMEVKNASSPIYPVSKWSENRNRGSVGAFISRFFGRFVVEFLLLPWSSNWGRCDVMPRMASYVSDVMLSMASRQPTGPPGRWMGPFQPAAVGAIVAEW